MPGQPERRRTEQRRQRGSTSHSTAQSTLFPACPGSSRKQRGQLSAQSPSAECRPVRPPAATPHRNIEHRNTNDGVRARASKTGNMPFVHTSPPFGSHRTAYSRSRSVRTLRLSPLRSASRTSCQRCRVRACTGTDARACSPRRTRSVCRLHLDAEQRPSARSRQRCAR